MRITRVIERTIKVESKIRNARVDLSEMTATIVAVVTDVILEGRPVVGYAFNSYGRYACGGSLRERFIPRLLAAEPESVLNAEGTNLDPPRIQASLLAREKAGGHAERSMALGTLDCALWDIVAKIERRPLYQVLSDRFGSGRSVTTVPVYVGGGFYGAEDPASTLRDEVSRWTDAGYRDAKIKAGGVPLDIDRRRIETALELLPPGGRLALDLSCAFDAQAGVAFAREVKHYGLWWLEEPCDPLDYDGYHAVGETGVGIAGGENLFSAREFDNFLRYARLGSNIVLQPDPPLAYGMTGLLDILSTAATHGMPHASIYPHGGNLMSLHAVAGLDLGGVEAYLEQFGVFSGFGQEVRIVDGRATLPTLPGIGFEAQPALYAVMSDLVR